MTEDGFVRKPVDYMTPRHTPPTITVHALKENKRPVGFVWPEPQKAKPRRQKSAE